MYNSPITPPTNGKAIGNDFEMDFLKIFTPILIVYILMITGLACMSNRNKDKTKKLPKVYKERQLDRIPDETLESGRNKARKRLVP